MKIQVISYEKSIKYGIEHNYTYSSLNEPRAFDEFDINIISLQTEWLWRYNVNRQSSINAIKDFDSLQVLIGDVKKSIVIICFPQNYRYKYSYSGGSYNRSEQLKDMIPYLKDYLQHLLGNRSSYDLVYENSTTSCNKSEIKAAFYFKNIPIAEKSLTESNGGNHITTVKLDANIILTTLDISDSNAPISDLLSAMGLIYSNKDIPEWMNDYRCFDDAEQEMRIEAANEEIDKQQKIIDEAKEKLDKNLYYKSVLYTNGSALVESVFDMLEKMLGCDLSGFVDKKEEDFKIILPKVTFIGEIKGIGSNVKNENVSQLDLHCQTYQDYLDTEGLTEKVKGILIINPLRSKPPRDRDDVHEKQIELAKRYGSLIITTEILLLLFEAYLAGKVSSERILELFISETGLLTVPDFI